MCDVKESTQIVVAAIILSNDMKRILLTQRAGDKDYPFYWCHPGGKVEPGEKPIAALIRELQEEIGITIFQPMEIFDQRTFDPPVCKAPTTLITYVCLMPYGQRVMLLDATVGAGWFTPEEIYGLTVTPGLELLKSQLRERYGKSGSYS